ncbi:MAG: flagellar biosynthesis protein FlhB [Clostridiales bacterium]|jgi:flagellar biosynthetic protein FlhB|nr:flagellar biosynthesis protein FlhB [Clostridiales bacterium]
MINQPARHNVEQSMYFLIDLSFFSGDKTEKATPRKREKAREEGQVAKSQEVGTAFMFLGVFTALRVFGGWMFGKIQNLFGFGVKIVQDIDVVFDLNYVCGYINYLFMQTLIIAMPVFAVAAIVGVLSNLVQVGWKITPKALSPKFNRVNPLSGFKRIFSAQSLVTLLKSLAKFFVIALVIYNTVKDELNKLPHLAYMELGEALLHVSDLIVSMGVSVGGWFLAVAAADFVYTRLKHTKDLKMTKQEVKEESKQTEGNPQIKGRLRSKMREVSMRRMMQGVPGADVVITNPTHYAVALKYERNENKAPVCQAKGADFVARRIKEKAMESGVEIVENKEVARALYDSVEVGQEIPPDLYQAVAEILAYVYRPKKLA